MILVPVNYLRTQRIGLPSPLEFIVSHFEGEVLLRTNTSANKAALLNEVCPTAFRDLTTSNDRSMMPPRV